MTVVGSGRYAGGMTKRSGSERRTILESFRRSGQSVPSFAKDTSVSEATLYRWLKESGSPRSAGSTRRAAALRLVEAVPSCVPPTPLPVTALEWSWELQASGVTLRGRAEVPVEVVRAVVALAARSRA
jgi:transposase-like protein